MLVIAAVVTPLIGRRPASASARAPSRIATFGMLAAYIMRSPLSMASRGAAGSVTSTRASARCPWATSLLRPASATTRSIAACSSGLRASRRFANVPSADAGPARRASAPTAQQRAIRFRRNDIDRYLGSGQMRHDPQRPSVRCGRRLAGARESRHCTRAAARPGPRVVVAKGARDTALLGLWRRLRRTRSSRTSMATRADCRPARRFDLEEPFLRDGSVRELKFDCDDP